MAKWRGLEFDIDFNSYKSLIKEKCYYCNKKSTGLDRINNKAGYLVTNVLPCCKECNILRREIYTVKETKIMVNALLKYRAKNRE